MKKILFVLTAVIVLASCKSDQEKMLAKITALEQVDTGVSHFTELADLYMEYTQKFETDSSTKVKYLGTAADNYTRFQHFEKAIQGLKLLRPLIGDSAYLASRYAPLEAFCETKSGNHQAALTIYEEIARQQPLDPASTVELVQLYLKVASEAGDTLERETAHLKAARLLTHSGDSRSALNELTRFYATYPHSDKAAYAMFESANLLDRQFNNLDSARAVLKSLIERYPNDPFAADARVYLEKDLLGKSDMEQLRIITEGKL